LVSTLENTITAAKDEPKIFAWHLPLDMRIRMKSQTLEQSSPNLGSMLPTGGLPKMKAFVDNAKRQYLNQLMQQTNGNVMQASAVSGLPKTTLYDHLKKFAITKSNRNN